MHTLVQMRRTKRYTPHRLGPTSLESVKESLTFQAYQQTIKYVTLPSNYILLLIRCSVWYEQEGIERVVSCL